MEDINNDSDSTVELSSNLIKKRKLITLSIIDNKDKCQEFNDIQIKKLKKRCDTYIAKNVELTETVEELVEINEELKTKLDALELFLVEKNILLNKYQRANNTLIELKELLKSILD